MKMIISKQVRMKYSSVLVITLIAMTIFSCGGKSEKRETSKTDTLSRPDSINLVSALAKVEAEDGLQTLSSEVSGIIATVYKKEGDNVKAGDPIIALDQDYERIEENIASQEILTQQANLAADEAQIKEYLATLSEKEQDLAVTQKLANIGGDTKQNVLTKQKEIEVIKANLQAARARAKASQSQLSSLTLKQGQSKLNREKRVIKAKSDGILLSLEAITGASLNAFTNFATIKPKGDLILHGEIDEMFADKVKVGQVVTINYPGNSDTIAKGTVSYVSPILENKSLFYEKTGEVSDRRVRRFKVSLGNNSLLINAKVECKITIQ